MGPVDRHCPSVPSRDASLEWRKAIEHDENNEEREAEAQAPAGELLFDREAEAPPGAFISSRKSGVGMGIRPYEASGGLTPAKKSQDMMNPTQTTKPNSETT